MKKRLLLLLLLMGIASPGWCAWNATLPRDNEKLKDAPAQIRANLDAIALGTDPALQITNAKVAINASIVDTKLANITTAGKVSGAAITLLPNIPAAAGVLPVANAPSIDLIVPAQGTNGGKSLITNGTVVSWGYPGGLNLTGEAHGDIPIRNGTGWTRLPYGTSGQYLKTNGAGANPEWADVDISAFDIFTSSANFTAPAGTNTVLLTMVSGGGGGEGGASGNYAGGGGAAGNILIDIPYTVVAGNNYTVTINAGGAGGGAGGTNGGTGGSVVFDALTLAGGAGGGSVAAGTGGAAPSPSGSGSTAGTRCMPVGNGGNGDNPGWGGGGGSNMFGTGGAGNSSSGPGYNATGYGGGGGGGGSANPGQSAGGNGSPGIVIVRY